MASDGGGVVWKGSPVVLGSWGGGTVNLGRRWTKKSMWKCESVGGEKKEG